MKMKTGGVLLLSAAAALVALGCARSSTIEQDMLKALPGKEPSTSAETLFNARYDPSEDQRYGIPGS